MKLKVQLDLEVEVPDESEPADARGALAAHLAAHELSPTVVGEAVSVIEPEFTIVGVVKGKPKERWSETVRAADADAAEAKVLEADPNRVIAATVPIDPPPVPEPDQEQEQEQPGGSS